MSTKTGELREKLMAVIDLVCNRKLDPDEAKAIAALAGQINLSLQVESNIAAKGQTLNSVPMGHLAIGEDRLLVVDEEKPKDALQ